MNPYDFVRLVGEKPERGPVQQHEKYQGFSGRITCTLTARTPVFVSQFQPEAGGQRTTHQHLKFCRGKGRQPLIPGTSLKGVIRSVAEAAGNGCLSLPRQLVYERGRQEYSMPRGFEACQDAGRLCPTCRLFGMLNREAVFAGNVSVQDATAPADSPMQEFSLVVLSAPKLHHTPFYSRQPQDTRPPVRGRKFYYHRPQGVAQRSTQDGQNKSVEALLPDAVFTFEVEYNNLSQADFELLLFALTLWEDTCHKVGMGKPAGLGSARIEITELHALDYQARYRQLGGGWQEPLRGAALANFVEQHTARYRSGPGDNLLDLHRILRWDENNTTPINYPSREWFNQNPAAPLEKAP